MTTHSTTATLTRPLVPVRRFSARRALVGVGWLGLAGGAQLAAVRLLGHGLACPFRRMTGVRCPLCGTTTAAVALLDGRFLAAWQANAFSLVVFGLLAVATLCWAVEALGGPRVRVPGRLGTLWGDRLLGVLVALGIVFDVVRLSFGW